jgi:hypothetical protein
VLLPPAKCGAAIIRPNRVVGLELDGPVKVGNSPIDFLKHKVGRAAVRVEFRVIATIPEGLGAILHRELVFAVQLVEYAQRGS